jgi:hypothetical protein
MVSQIEEDDERQDNRRYPFDQKKPLPAGASA